jgi:hypothetical protein
VRVLVWVLVWVVLLAASGWYLWRCTRAVVRRAGRLADELAAAERLLAQVQQQAGARHTPGTGSAGTPGEATDLAVFMGVSRAAEEHRAARAALKEHRRARREASLPGWARRVDSGSTRPRKGVS